MIEAEGGIASTIQADVTSDDDCKALVAAAVDRFGRLDILDNNVGNIIGAPVTEIDPAEWDALMALNLKSMMLTSRHAIPRMVESGGGSIINISSINGVRAAKSVAYSASKAGVMGLTIAMAADHGRQGIRVNAIAPGAVYTPMVSWNMSHEMREHRKSTTMLGIEGTPWDVAWAAVFLASEEARWITGSVLTVDGGASMMSRHAYFDE
jgi:NAD(P)-dependent dehydrogenase (short-subunit alcohol dehydrogenase family)